MKIRPETKKAIVEVMKSLGIDNTVDNREKFVDYAIIHGLVGVSNSIGLFSSIENEFSVKIIKLEEQEKAPQKTPKVCPHCDKPIIWNGAKWVCNCRIYPYGPSEDN